MNDDYLWDKTGDVDAEIERLETILQTFRHSNDCAPALPPREIAPIRRLFARSAARLTFAAAAACVLFAIVWFGARFAFDAQPRETAQNLAPQIGDAQIGDAQTVEAPREISTVAADVADETTTNASLVRPPRRKLRAARAAIGKSFSNNRRVAPDSPRAANSRRVVNAAPQAELSAAEIAAYDKLRLALSIAGSKLRLVKDKIEQPND